MVKGPMTLSADMKIFKEVVESRERDMAVTIMTNITMTTSMMTSMMTIMMTIMTTSVTMFVMTSLLPCMKI